MVAERPHQRDGRRAAASVLATVRRDNMEAAALARACRRRRKKRSRRRYGEQIRSAGSSVLCDREAVGRWHHRPGGHAARARPEPVGESQRPDRTDAVRLVSNVNGAMFRKILIANRGEIACRIIATARRLGIRDCVGAFRVRDVMMRARCSGDAGRRGVADRARAGARQLFGRRENRRSRPLVGRRGDPSRLWVPLGERRLRWRPARRPRHRVVLVGPAGGGVVARCGPEDPAAKTLMEKAGVPLVPVISRRSARLFDVGGGGGARSTGGRRVNLAAPACGGGRAAAYRPSGRV